MDERESNKIVSVGVSPDTGSAGKSAKRPPLALPHTCGGCGSRWSGTVTAHCSGCHKTFGGVGGFDWHRFRERCRTVDELVEGGYVLTSRGRYSVWSQGDVLFGGDPSEAA